MTDKPASDAWKGISAKHKLFAELYVEDCDFNATDAAARAGYAESSARVQGSRMLSNSNVRAYVDHLTGRMKEQLGLNPMRVIREYMRIAFVSTDDLMTFTSGGVKLKSSEQMPTGAKAAISSVKMTKEGVHVTMHDKQRALEWLSKNLRILDGGDGEGVTIRLLLGGDMKEYAEPDAGELPEAAPVVNTFEAED